MSIDKAIADPVIGRIIKENPDIFITDAWSKGGKAWKEVLTLFIFLLYEW